MEANMSFQTVTNAGKYALVQQKVYFITSGKNIALSLSQPANKGSSLVIQVDQMHA